MQCSEGVSAVEDRKIAIDGCLVRKVVLGRREKREICTSDAYNRTGVVGAMLGRLLKFSRRFARAGDNGT